MNRSVQWVGLSGLVIGVALGVSCKATSDGLVGRGGSSPESSAGQGGATSASNGIGGCFGDGCISSSSAGMVPPPCKTDLVVDDDGDGYSEQDGDCDDCNAQSGPGSVEVVGDAMSPGYVPVDEDCDGAIDEPLDPCDANLALYSIDAMDVARAVDLCKASSNAADWGVISAKWVMADGSPTNDSASFHLGHGILSSFGPNVKPRMGGRMLGISSGTARQPSEPGYVPSTEGFIKNYAGNHPEGFPKEAAACPGVVTGQPNDVTAVELEIRAPANAKGFSFEFDFYTSEWPNYICTKYNDLFIAILSPPPGGQTDGQISFDAQGNPISVNNAFLSVCACASAPPCYAGGKPFGCSLGASELLATGFDGHAATGWLSTHAPIEPGEVFRIRWGVYDSGDGKFDSTTLVDHWQWIAESGTTVGTAPAPEVPK